MNKIKIKIFTFFCLIITLPLVLSSCDILWDDLNTLPTFTITYVSDKGTAPESKTVEQGYKLTAEDLPVLTETGYRFIGWDKAVGNEITSDTTITASWIKTWTITYNSNNGTGTMEPQIFEENVPQALSENKFTREGYTFAGWATAADASEAGYADKASFTATKDITLYAIWSVIPPARFTITYASTYGTKPVNKEVDKGYKLTAEDLPDLTETGYRFINWDKVVGDEITSDTTITASWIKTWTISYASNKSELNDKLPASKTVDEGYKLTASDLNTLTADGYNFKGWDKTAGFEIKADVTITATWKKLVTISYSSTYGTKPENKTVEEGYKLVAEDLKLLPETDTMYCDSWDKSAGTEITADTTITAKWETIVYLTNFSKVTDIKTNKAKIEKIVFTSDTYSGAATTIDCSDTAGYFTGVLTDGTVSGQYILTVYGNGHRIYAPIDCSQLFYNYKVLTTIEFSNFYTSKTTNMSGMFAMSNALNSLNVSGFNTAKVTNMTGMFTGYKDTVLNLSNFDTSKVENMQNMFQACTNLTTLNISSFNTSAVTNMFNMFYGCSSLTSLDVSKFVTAKVTNMKQMFADCYGLEELDLSNFDTSEVTDMSLMFYCTNTDKSNLKKIIFSSKFKTDKVTTVKQMFYRCDKLTELDISSFDTSSVLWTSIGGCGLSIFNGCSSLVTIYASDKFVSTAPNLTIFDGCTSLVGGTGTRYSDCETSDPEHYKTALYARIDGGSSNPGYFTLKQ